MGHAQDLACRVDGVLGHLPICGQLAAGHGDDVARAATDLVTPRKIRGTAGGCALDEWPQARPDAGDVGLRDTGRDGCIEGFQYVGDVVFGALRVVDRTVVVRVSGADVGVLERAIGAATPRDDEQAALVLGHGDHNSDVVANLLPRHGEVHTLGRSDGVRIGTLV